jgi:hypothetical protein
MNKKNAFTVGHQLPRKTVKREINSSINVLNMENNLLAESD